MLNRAIFTGRLTKKPELRYTASGVAVTNFTLAVNRVVKPQNGPDADFINCVAWRKQAENLCQYQDKGNLIAIDSRVQTRTYVDQNTQKTIYVTEFVTDSIQFLTPKNNGNATTGTNDSYNASSYGEPPPEPPGDNDMPF